jgi:cytochrome P450 family 2 subfamily U polypeptide 1
VFFLLQISWEILSPEFSLLAVKQLSGVIADLFIAGSHTTTATLRWAIICLVQYPDIQERIYKLLCSSIGTQRLPSSTDKTSLAYLEAFYLEVLR